MGTGTGSACTCAPRTTSSRATARCVARPAARRLHRGPWTPVVRGRRGSRRARARSRDGSQRDGSSRRRRPHPPRVSAVASPIHSARPLRHRIEHARINNAVTEDGPAPRAGSLARHDIIVKPHPPGHRCAARLPHRRPPRHEARDAGRRRPLRPGHGVQLGDSHLVRPPDRHRRRHCGLFRGRSQPVVSVELRDVGDQRGPAAVPPHRAGGKRRVGHEPHDPHGRRDPWRRDTRCHAPTATRARAPVVVGLERRPLAAVRDGRGWIRPDCRHAPGDARGCAGPRRSPADWEVAPPGARPGRGSRRGGTRRRPRDQRA